MIIIVPGAPLASIFQRLMTAKLNWVQMLDLHMLALFGSRQRSREEYEALLRQSGFRPAGLIDTFSGAAIVEAP